jgi:hypothetical protein
LQELQSFIHQQRISFNKIDRGVDEEDVTNPHSWGEPINEWLYAQEHCKFRKDYY